LDAGKGSSGCGSDQNAFARWSTEDAAEPVEYASEKDLKKIANHLHNLLVGTQEDSYVEEAEQLKADNPQLFA